MTNKCYRKKIDEIPVVELTTSFSLLVWIILVISILAVVGLSTYLFTRPYTYENEIERGQMLTDYSIELQPPRIANYEQVKTGCDYWFGVIDNLDANETEKKWLKDIMFCESTCNPNAVSYAGATGLLQFMPKTWEWMGGGDIHNSYEQIDKALMMYRKGMASHWCCNDLIYN